METIYFLVFVGVIAFAVVWAARKSNNDKKDLASKRKSKKANSTPDLLSTPAGTRLSRKDEIWELRREHASKDLSAAKRFVPKFESGAEPQYDGYSRRDRHHLTTVGKVAEESHTDKD
jgi:hypothetical protein